MGLFSWHWGKQASESTLTCVFILALTNEDVTSLTFAAFKFARPWIKASLRFVRIERPKLMRFLVTSLLYLCLMWRCVAAKRDVRRNSAGKLFPRKAMADPGGQRRTELICRTLWHFWNPRSFATCTREEVRASCRVFVNLSSRKSAPGTQTPLFSQWCRKI